VVSAEMADHFSRWLWLACAADFVEHVEAEMPKAWFGAPQFQRDSSFQQFQSLAGRSTIRLWPGALGNSQPAPMSEPTGPSEED
jgi:hypothetical protein